jgi:hypothetical protein
VSRSSRTGSGMVMGIRSISGRQSGPNGTIRSDVPSVANCI